MPCGKDTLRCEMSASYLHDLAPCCLSHIRTMVVEVGKLLDAAGIPWWIDYGTLLGAVREGRIIPWDKDADCGFMWNDAPRFRSLVHGWQGDPNNPHRPAGELAAGPAGRLYVLEIQRSGRTLYSKGDTIKVHWSQRNRTCVDYFGWRSDAVTGLVSRERYCLVDQFKGREFHADRLFPLGQIEWEGFTVPCPRDPEWFVAHRYGPEWRKPRRQNNDGVKR